MHSVGQYRSHTLQPVQDGSSMTSSQSRAGKPRLRGESGMCSPPRALEGPSPSAGLPGYWTVTGFRAIVSRVTPSPLRKPII